MPIDAYRSGDHFVVEFDLPGISVDSIDLTVERNVLTVHASRVRQDGDGNGKELVVSERPFGSFSRQLFLGETLDTEAIKATYTDGVLRLEIPVAEQAKPRKVEVQAVTSQHVIAA
jgi:HSP20 family protein